MLAFHASSLYSYEQTEGLLKAMKAYKKVHGQAFQIEGFDFHAPHQFKVSKGGGIERRKSLSEIVFVRLVSALEVFLIDLVRDAFLSSKKPFMRTDVQLSFTQAELLTNRSTAEIYGKIINKECRKLSSGGFIDIVKYYSRHFEIDLGGFSPGLKKMGEYHDRRNLLVHRLGRTDEQYRRKYNFRKPGIAIDVEYLMACAKDFAEFAKLVQNQMAYALQVISAENPTRSKMVERRIRFNVQVLGSLSQNFLDSHYEFWSGDEFSRLSDLLDERRETDEQNQELTISGTLGVVRSYFRIVRSSQKRKEIRLRVLDEEVLIGQTQPLPKRVVVDEALIERVKNLLPTQPWPKGVHREVAATLQTRVGAVSIAIQQLIATGIFKRQIDGELFDVVPDSAPRDLERKSESTYTLEG